MPRIVSNQLTALKVARLRAPGTYADGNGLYLTVGTSGARSWFYRYYSTGRVREMGLGSVRDVTLAEARELAVDFRRKRRAGIDPADARKAEREAKRAANSAVEAAKARTFRAVAEEYIAIHRPTWKSPTHARQWPQSLEDYVYPLIGDMPVADVGRSHVRDVLEPFWSEKNVTASRVRGRIEKVLDYAKAREWRSGDNPACWNGHLEAVLPAKSAVRSVKHHTAMPYADVPIFLVRLRGENGIAARAFEFAILTAARTSEAIGTAWSEVDVDATTWTIPADRMKGGREHKVPLSDHAVAILMEMQPLRQPGSDYVFPGGKPGKPLSTMAFLMLLRRMQVDVTAHGFRSSFRDWAGDETTAPREVAEACLAHAIRDRVEAAYRRSDALAKRRDLLAAWSSFCLSETGQTS